MGDLLRKQMLKNRDNKAYEEKFLKVAETLPFIEKISEEAGKELLNKINSAIELQVEQRSELSDDIMKAEFREYVFNSLVTGIFAEVIKANSK